MRKEVSLVIFPCYYDNPKEKNIYGRLWILVPVTDWFI